MTFEISPRQLLVALIVIISLLTLTHLGLQAARFITDNHSLFGLIWLFSMGADGNVPTYYSSLGLLLCSILLTLVGLGAAGDGRIRPAYWFGLAVIFLGLCADEMLMLHEKLIEPVRGALNAGGIFYYAWVIPYGLALLVFLAIYARFLLRLPGRTRWLFIVSGTIFVAGAIGMEMAGGWYSEKYGNLTIAYVALQTIEEFMEMLGIAIFAYAIADYCKRHCGGLVISLGGSPSGDS